MLVAPGLRSLLGHLDGGTRRSTKKQTTTNHLKDLCSRDATQEGRMEGARGRSRPADSYAKKWAISSCYDGRPDDSLYHPTPPLPLFVS